MENDFTCKYYLLGRFHVSTQKGLGTQREGKAGFIPATLPQEEGVKVTARQCPCGLVHTTTSLAGFNFKIGYSPRNGVRVFEVTSKLGDISWSSGRKKRQHRKLCWDNPTTKSEKKVKITDFDDNRIGNGKSEH